MKISVDKSATETSAPTPKKSKMRLAPVFGLAVFALFCRGSEAEVTKCYFCYGSCDNPTEQICEDLLGKQDYVCTTATDPYGAEARTCMPSTQAGPYCSVYIEVGASCTFCGSDLCNDEGVKHSTTTHKTPSPTIPKNPSPTTPSGAEHHSSSLASAVVLSVLVFLAKF